MKIKVQAWHADVGKSAKILYLYEIISIWCSLRCCEAVFFNKRLRSVTFILTINDKR